MRAPSKPNMESTNIFPVPNSTLSYWRSQPHELDNYRSTEQLPKECDVLIIGAGMSGVSTAYFLLDDNPSPPTTVLLEARELCSGATGRNGGHTISVSPLTGKIVEKHGVDAARELMLFRKDILFAMKRVAEKEDLDCDAVITRYFEVLLDQSHADEIKKDYDKVREADYDFAQDQDYVGPKNVAKLSGMKNAKGGLTTTALQLWPYKFVTQLLARLVERTSINVQTRTRVTGVSTSEDGTSIVTTPRGSIRARKVIFATNGYTAGIAPIFEKKIVPRKGTCSHITPAKDTLNPPPHLTHTYGVNFDSTYRDYLIPRPDGGIMCGGAQRTYVKDTKLWYNNWDDSTLIEQARPHFETVMQDNFIGWEKSGAAVDYLWTGIMAQTSDGYPYCGEVPGQDNHYVLAGYNGSGMSMIFLTAKGIAKMIREGVPFEQSGIPRLFKATQERLKVDVTPYGVKHSTV